jgi:hypothetical protein
MVMNSGQANNCLLKSLYFVMIKKTKTRGNMHYNLFHLFKTVRFLALFITQFLGAFNDNIFKNALVVLITYDVGVRAGFDPALLVLIAAAICQNIRSSEKVCQNFG